MIIRSIACVLVVGVSLAASTQVFAQDKSNEAVTAEQRQAVPEELRNRLVQECRTQMKAKMLGSQAQARLFMETCMQDALKNAQQTAEKK